jgi:hypothetical protein
LSTKTDTRSGISGSKKTYLVVNAVFILIIISVFIYSAIIDPENGNYPLKSFSRALTDEDSISTGLSRSFSELVRLDLTAAAEYNPYGLRIFLFAIVQFFIRILISLILIFNRDLRIGLLVFFDFLQASVLFLAAFFPFLAYFSDKIF